MDEGKIMDEEKTNCPHCGKLIEPMESETAAGTLLLCPECYKLIGRRD
ncbi:hypothetical protein J4441_02815 [Candidatus Micrarchaeota archaeon]|nr:hypothetical protein [Candidatus Micrarchaeota archaeon]